MVPELVEQGIPSGHAEAKPLVLEPVEMGIFADTQLGGFYFEVALELRLEVVPGMRLEAGPSQVAPSQVAPSQVAPSQVVPSQVESHWVASTCPW